MKSSLIATPRRWNHAIDFVFMIRLNLHFETESGKQGAKYTVCLERKENGIRCQVFSATSEKKKNYKQRYRGKEFSAFQAVVVLHAGKCSEVCHRAFTFLFV